MGDQIAQSLSGIAAFGAYFGGSVLLLALFTLVYGLITPYKEIRLIGQGKTAPAVSFGGAILGFVCPMVSAIAHSVGLVDMIIWSMIALVVQLLVFVVIRLLFHHLVKDIEHDKMAPAVFLAFLSVAVGLLSAACITY